MIIQNYDIVTLFIPYKCVGMTLVGIILVAEKCDEIVVVGMRAECD